MRIALYTIGFLSLAYLIWLVFEPASGHDRACQESPGSLLRLLYCP